MKTKLTVEIKDDYYKISDGMMGLKEAFGNNNDIKGMEMIKKLQEINAELYKHLGNP